MEARSSLPTAGSLRSASAGPTSPKSISGSSTSPLMAFVPKSDLQDARIAVCVPAALSADTREALSEYVACKAMLKHYNDRDHPSKGAFRDWAKTRRREAMAAVLSAQVAEYRRGTILTQKELGLPATEYFLPVGKPAGKKKDDATITLQKDRAKREESLASELLEKAYDALSSPLPTSRKHSRTPMPARSSTGSSAGRRAVRTPAPGQLRRRAWTCRQEQSHPVRPPIGLGRAADPRSSAQRQRPFGVRGRQGAVPAAPRSDRRPGQAGHPLRHARGYAAAGDHRAEPLVRLQARERQGATGKATHGRSRSSQVEWSLGLEKALLGARIKLSDEKSFNEVLAYARVLDPTMTPAHNLDDETDRNQELVARLKTFAEDLEKTHDTLKVLAKKLDGQVDDATTEAFQRLKAIAATCDFQEFHAVARESYPTAEAFQTAYKVFEKAARLTDRYAELQPARDYVDGLAVLEETKLGGQAQMLKAQLTFSALWGGDEAKVSSILEQFRRFRDQYSLAYRKAHRACHERREAIEKSLAELDDQLTVIERLNGLELGGRVGERLAAEVQSLANRVHPCALKDATQPFDDALCPECHWDGQAKPPVDEAEAIRKRVADAAHDLCKRVAQEAIRKILESSGETTVQILLDMVTASRISELARVLTPEMVTRVREILASANVEIRSLALTDLIEGYGVLEEGQIDDLLKRLRERLRQRFDEAKLSTEGKKRIRFMLQ